VMFEIDEAKKRFAAAEATLKANIKGYEERIASLHEKEKNLTVELKDAQAEVATARTPLDPPALRIYDRVSGRHVHPIVPIRGGKCGGCHLKVSSEVESEARRGENLAICDQCGRIVWWES
jgi:uncharacterized protein